MNLHLINERSKKPNHHKGCFKYLAILFAIYTSIKLKFNIFKLKKGYKKHVTEGFNNSQFSSSCPCESEGKAGPASNFDNQQVPK